MDWLVLVAGRMVGCPAMRTVTLLLGITSVLASASCYDRDRWDALLAQRASFDFNCPPQQLRLVDMGDRLVRGVEGCGHRATYIQNPHTGTWVMNTEQGPAPR
jgi:hypothetical protein